MPPWIRNLSIRFVAGVSFLQATAWLFDFEGAVQSFVSRNPVLTLICSGVWLLYAHIIWDLDKLAEQR